MKKGYNENIEKLTQNNSDFRHVLYTAEHMQLVLMSLKPGEEIGEEVHEKNDQFFRFENGEGQVFVNDEVYNVTDGDTVIIPSGAKHNVVNTGDQDLKMYTIYSPAHHKDGIIRATKQDATLNEEEFDGQTTE